jgi:hypothetical protein
MRVAEREVVEGGERMAREEVLQENRSPRQPALTDRTRIPGS